MLATLLGVAVFLAIAAGLFVPFEAATAPARRPFSWQSAALCAGLFALNTLLMASVGGLALDGAALLAPRLEPPGPARILLVMVLGDLCGYAMHRLAHRVPALWRFHAVHHRAPHLTWLEAWRQHPLDFLLQGIAVGLPAALLDASLADLGLVVLLRKLFTSFLHADTGLRLGPLEWVLASPAFHRVHHSQAREDFDHNFAGTFPAIDRLFGTYRAPTSLPVEARAG